MAIRVSDSKVTKSSVYRDAGDARYEEAEFLKDDFPTAAIYLGGYLIECYLKWALCERSSVRYLQDLSDNDLVSLLLSGQGHDLERLCTITSYEVHFSNNEKVKRAFQVAAAWSPNIRYARSCGGAREADTMMTVADIEVQLAEMAKTLKFENAEQRVEKSGKWIHVLISTPTFEGLTSSQRENLVWREFEKRFDDETILAITQCYLLTHDERAASLAD